MPPLAGFGPSSFSGIHCGIHLGKTGGPKPAENLDSDRHRLNSLFGHVGNLLSRVTYINHLEDGGRSPEGPESAFSLYFPVTRELERDPTLGCARLPDGAGA